MRRDAERRRSHQLQTATSYEVPTERHEDESLILLQRTHSVELKEQCRRRRNQSSVQQSVVTAEKVSGSGPSPRPGQPLYPSSERHFLRPNFTGHLRSCSPTTLSIANLSPRRSVWTMLLHLFTLRSYILQHLSRCPPAQPSRLSQECPRCPNILGYPLGSSSMRTLHEAYTLPSTLHQLRSYALLGMLFCQP
jgi:hypothetical protein